MTILSASHLHWVGLGWRWLSPQQPVQCRALHLWLEQPWYHTSVLSVAEQCWTASAHSSKIFLQSDNNKLLSALTHFMVQPSKDRHCAAGQRRSWPRSVAGQCPQHQARGRKPPLEDHQWWQSWGRTALPESFPAWPCQEERRKGWFALCWFVRSLRWWGWVDL